MTVAMFRMTTTTFEFGDLNDIKQRVVRCRVDNCEASGKRMDLEVSVRVPVVGGTPDFSWFPPQRCSVSTKDMTGTKLAAWVLRFSLGEKHTSAQRGNSFVKIARTLSIMFGVPLTGDSYEAGVRDSEDSSVCVGKTEQTGTADAPGDADGRGMGTGADRVCSGKRRTKPASKSSSKGQQSRSRSDVQGQRPDAFDRDGTGEGLTAADFPPES